MGSEVWIAIDVILFTRNYKIPIIEPPTLSGIRLAFSNKVKFLGIILDRKLDWGPNIKEWSSRPLFLEECHWKKLGSSTQNSLLPL